MSVSASPSRATDGAAARRQKGAREPAPPWVRLVQLTDLHLFAAPHARLLGFTTRRSFAAVLEAALSRPMPAGALVLTGDLVHDESPEGYRALRRTLDSTGLTCYCIPGNHDSFPMMQRWLGPAAVGPLATRRLDAWNLVFLDSSRPGSDSGRIGHARLASLDRALAADSAPAAVFLHQHPVPVESAWMDTMAVEDGAMLLAICDRHPQVRAVVCGHIHQELERPRGHYRVLGTPSTCVQFTPGSGAFAIDDRPPGYREIRLFRDGRLESEVVRLAGYPERGDPRAPGYER